MSSKNKKKSVSTNKKTAPHRDESVLSKKEATLKNIRPDDVGEMLDALPNDTQEALVRLVAVQRESYAGPIPHPSILRQFNEIIPNGADRIMSMSEKQTSHRIDMERNVITANNRDSFIGLIIAGILGVSGIFLGAWLFAIGNNFGGAALTGGTLFSLVSTFITGTKRDKKDLDDKNN